MIKKNWFFILYKILKSKNYYNMIQIQNILYIISIILRYSNNLYIKKANNFIIILKYLLLKIINNKFNNKKFYIIIKTNFVFKTLIINTINISY